MHNASIDTAPLAGSKTAADGLLAALLAEQGFDTDADAFEHLQGFLKVDVERLFANWTAPLEIEAASGDNSATRRNKPFVIWSIKYGVSSQMSVVNRTASDNWCGDPSRSRRRLYKQLISLVGPAGLEPATR